MVIYNVLSVAYLEGAINGPNTTGLIVRADWLEKLDIDIPETIDRFYEMLKAFKEQDPDGNGQDDTFGYIGRDTTLFEDVFGAFGIQPTFWMETKRDCVWEAHCQLLKRHLQYCNNGMQRA